MITERAYIAFNENATVITRDQLVVFATGKQWKDWHKLTGKIITVGALPVHFDTAPEYFVELSHGNID